MVTPSMIQDIFTTLDRQNRHRLSITDIEGLFKEHSRKQNPNINPDEVILQIIIAFAGDTSFIEQ